MKTRLLAVHWVLAVLAITWTGQARAEVTRSANDGFQTVSVQSTPADPATVYSCLTDDVARWWDPGHTFSGAAGNLSMDFQQHCLLEKLPDGGFVRHLEMVYHHPGKTLRLCGGLGPLQEMGLAGALTINLREKDGQTEITLTYNVTGSAAQQLDQIAPAVDSVLAQQLERLKKYCDKKVTDESGN